MTISTESGSRWESVMAADDASRTGGMQSSVLMWAGMAGDVADDGDWRATGSWTSRSKICDTAGDTMCDVLDAWPAAGDDGSGGLTGLVVFVVAALGAVAIFEV